ncbi:MAG: metal ABC transporter solute-binding protein, Zn/Mn family [Puniceicoccaceae bacterium]
MKPIHPDSDSSGGAGSFSSRGRRGRPLALVLAAFSALALFPGAAAADDPERYTVVTTVGMITDIVRNVAGDKAEVRGLIGEGIDPHLYKPTRGDVMALGRADVIFYNGLMLEGKMSDLFVRMAGRGKPVVPVTAEVLDGGDYVLTDEDNHYDPHVWMDVRGWILATGVVEETLAGFDPANGEFYRANAAAYRERLEALDAYAAEAIGSIPEERRVLVTAHDAFRYLGRAYGIEVKGIQGISTESEAGVRDIENLVDFLVSSGIPAVFVETSVSDKNVRALVEGAAARGHELRIGGKLFSDAMGPRGTYEGTYVGMIDHNVTTIAAALGGDVPPRGLNGKLGEERE